jgi:hypothetical protein
MAAIEIGQLPLTTSVINTTQLPVENANVTLKIEAASLKNYMTSLPQLTVDANITAGNISTAIGAFSTVNTGLLQSSGNVVGTILNSTAVTGTPPLNVSSTTQVPNLYASRAALADITTDGLTIASSFANIASTDVIISGNNSTIGANLRTVNTNIGTFGNTIRVPQLTVDAKGRITGVSNVAITFPAQSLLANTSEITANVASGNPGLSLTVTGVTAGTYGGAINVPQITVDNKGRVTNITSVPVNSTLNTLNIGIPIGTIAIWSGALATIPDGWALCDGTNGTQDLRNRFVVGAGSTYSPNATGGTADAVVPSHTHTATSTSTFTGAALPTHTHGTTESGHRHQTGVGGEPGLNNKYGDAGNMGTGWRIGNAGGPGVDSYTNFVSTGLTVNAQTAGTPSGTVVTSTTLSTEGVSGVGTNLPPYMALYYIQKITDAVSINNPINYMATVGNIIAGGNMVAASGNISANTRTGSMVVIGGLGVTGNINVGSGSGNAIVANGNIVVNGSLIVGGVGGGAGGLIPPGGIIAWSGSEASIPNGWFLCNGGNGTPDLRSRFIVGAGTGSAYAVGGTGGTADAVVVTHTHTVSDPGHVHLMAQVPTTFRVADGVIDGSYSANNQDRNYTDRDTNTNTTGITIQAQGVSGTNQNLPPYYALCFIMKA